MKKEIKVDKITLYFDESGFTGENLLDKSQPTFAYGSVNISNEESKKIVSNIVKKYKLQNTELKGVKLIRRNKGKQAILEILEILKDKIKVSAHDKKYALAGKFFEYIFEPALAKNSLLFYKINFHKFIANTLYRSFISNDDLTTKMMILFEKLMRKKEVTYLDEIITLMNKNNSDSADFFAKIIIFIDNHRNIIINEIQDLSPWTIDLSITSLNALFSEWGTSGKQIVAFCDNSKPIDEQKKMFDSMLGQKEIKYSEPINNEGTRIPLTYNLEKISLVDSKKHFGIQLADIVATATAYSFRMYQEDNEFTNKLKDILLPKIVYASAFPDFDYIKLETKESRLNGIIFEEIIKRTKYNISIVDNMEKFIESKSLI